MKFLLDQSAESRIQVHLNAFGHDATRIGKEYPAGLPDEEVLAIAVKEERILITNDRDFWELIFSNNLPHFGVIYFRFPMDSNAFQKIDSIDEVLDKHKNDLGKFLVVRPSGVRVK